MSFFVLFDVQIQVLLIDDDLYLCQVLCQMFDFVGFKVVILDDVCQLDIVQCKDWFGVVVSDICMFGIDGMELFC